MTESDPALPERMPYLEIDGQQTARLQPSEPAPTPQPPVDLPENATLPIEPVAESQRITWQAYIRSLPRLPLGLMFLSLILTILLLPRFILLLATFLAEFALMSRILLVPLLAFGLGFYLLRLLYYRHFRS